jgi:hypothetical protein
MLFIRLIAHFIGIKVSKAIYSGLYFYPLLAMGHLIFGGIICKFISRLLISAAQVSKSKECGVIEMKILLLFSPQMLSSHILPSSHQSSPVPTISQKERNR